MTARSLHSSVYRAFNRRGGTYVASNLLALVRIAVSPTRGATTALYSAANITFGSERQVHLQPRRLRCCGCRQASALDCQHKQRGRHQLRRVPEIVSERTVTNWKPMIKVGYRRNVPIRVGQLAEWTKSFLRSK